MSKLLTKIDILFERRKNAEARLLLYCSMHPFDFKTHTKMYFIRKAANALLDAEKVLTSEIAWQDHRAMRHGARVLR